MGYFRVLIGFVLLAAVVEFLAPLLSIKAGILVPLIRNNCGAVPVFLKDISMVGSSPDPRYWRGFITCGGSIIGFLLLPGFLKVLKFIYSHFFSSGSKNRRA